MNTLKTVFLAAALLLTSGAQAALVPISEMLELTPSELRVPANEASRINVKPCSTCEERTVKVTRDTVYRIAGPDSAPVSLSDFSRCC